MKHWKYKVNIPLEGFGLCCVTEHTDQEAERLRRMRPARLAMPICAGFVNLFRDGDYIGNCGVEYAKQHLTTELDELANS